MNVQVGSSGSTDDSLVEFQRLLLAGRQLRMAQQALAGVLAVAARRKLRLVLTRLILLDDLLQVVLVVVKRFAADFRRGWSVGEERDRQGLLQHQLCRDSRVVMAIKGRRVVS